MSMVDISQIQNGWDVYGSDGDKVGDVSDLGPNYVLVTKGFLFTKDIYIPTSAVTGVEQDRVYLNVTKDQIDSMGWDQAPADDAGYGAAAPGGTMTGGTTGTTGTMTGRTTGTMADETTGDMTGRTTGAMVTDDSTTVSTQTTDTQYTQQPVQQTQYTEPVQETSAASTTGDDSLRIQRYEEDLGATTVQRQAGEVRVTKDVVEEERTIDVPVTREEVHVESRAVDRAATDTSGAFQEGTISVPVREEDVQVSKEVRVVEELEIAKTAVQETERVTDTVRREVVDIETVGDVDVEGGTTDSGGMRRGR